MSTSPDERQGAKPRLSPVAASSPDHAAVQDIGQAGLIRSVVWIIVGIVIAVVVGMNYELVWELLSEGVPLALEVAEDALDTFFERVVHLSPGMSQMATAYVGVVSLLVISYFLLRKFIQLGKHAGKTVATVQAAAANICRRWWEVKRQSLIDWWNSLTLANKVVAVTALVLIVIPLAMVASLVLGSLFASLL